MSEDKGIPVSGKGVFAEVVDRPKSGPNWVDLRVGEVLIHSCCERAFAANLADDINAAFSKAVAEAVGKAEKELYEAGYVEAAYFLKYRDVKTGKLTGIRSRPAGRG